LDILKTRADLQSELHSARAAGKRIALVPTMGYLHEGHLTLCDVAHQHGDVVIMSIYVNPLQFGPSEDLARYPRDLERDAALARERAVDFIFAPDDEEMYGADQPAVRVYAPELSNRLCGRFRPGHFEGVLTVVAKLFNIVQPNAAVFGQKDFQQHVLIRRMVRDLSYDIDIVVAPVMREKDGLAMSSRNVFLSSEERMAAVALSRALRVAQLRYRDGERNPAALLAGARQLLDGEPGVRVQYLELVDAASLETPARAADTNVMAVAALVGKTRLIDNVVISAG
jgi:pantoate--beta-alanine ligase